MSSNALAKQGQMAELDLTRTTDIAKVFVQSGYWSEVGSGSKAMVKVMAGREMGIGAFTAMQGINIIKGKLQLTANLLASMVKMSDKYDYRVRELTNEICRLEFFLLVNGQEPESLGFSDFSWGDAQTAGLATGNVWKSYPRNMMFARAMSNGVNLHCPDVTKGIRAYTEGDDFGPMPEPVHEQSGLAAALDGDEPPPKVIEAQVVEKSKPEPPPKKKAKGKKKAAPKKEKVVDVEVVVEPEPEPPTAESEGATRSMAVDADEEDEKEAAEAEEEEAPVADAAEDEGQEWTDSLFGGGE